MIAMIEAGNGSHHGRGRGISLIAARSLSHGCENCSLKGRDHFLGFTRPREEGTMCKTIKQRVKFKADPATVYDLLADSRKHTAFTGRPAIISRKVGGTFTLGE